MTIISPSFQEKDFIPKKFTCQGENVNPELRFGAVPEQAKSLALVMDDPDAPMGTFTHWLLWNINPKVYSISEHSVPDGAVEGKNGTSKIGHIGPCPPSGTHRYFFKLYALDAMLELSPDASKTARESAIQKHLIASAELVGLYKKE